MKLISQSWEWIQKSSDYADVVELAGRVCYKSEHKISEGTSSQFIKAILERQHESVIEHVVASVRFTTSRSVTHELVRHRLCSFSQESTRYIRYKEDLALIKPVWWDDKDYPEQNKKLWLNAMEQAEESYFALLEAGERPEQAREVLPHALKTEIIVTANLREWRHIFKMRCTKSAHPQIRQLMISCLQGFAAEMPIIFADLLVFIGIAH